MEEKEVGEWENILRIEKRIISLFIEVWWKRNSIGEFKKREVNGWKRHSKNIQKRKMYMYVCKGGLEYLEIGIGS